MDKNTFYNPSWEDASQYPEYASWITRGSDSKHFKCKVCPTGVSLKLSNMGTEALKSHITGNKKKKGDSKHETNMNKYLKLLQGQKKIGFTSPSSVLSPVTSPTFASTSHTSLPETPSSTALASTSSDSLVEHSNNPKKQMTFRTSGTKDKAKAEILLAMKAVVSHIPQRTLDDFNKLAMKMFPDSQIAKDMESGRTKLGYNINYGLAPYYKDKLLKTLQGGESVAPKFTACFDESYNTVTHSKQFDVHVIYFDEITKRVRRKYLTSQFIGHGDANSLLDHFNKVLDNKLDAKNLIQISMDGPNVNWKMLELVTEERKKDPLCPELLLLGSCGLHILHGGYQTAQECTEWNLGKKILKPIFSIFNKSPARRADYLISNDLYDQHQGKCTSYLFPMKYCGHRWLENGKAIRRVMEIYPKELKYFKYLKDRKKFPAKDDRFTDLQEKLSSPMLPPILEFSLAIMNDIEPDLILFQAERPLAVFLHERLHSLMLGLVRRFVRPEVLDANSTTSKMMKIDLDVEANLLPPMSINIGFGAKKALKTLKTTHALEVRNFYTNTQKLLKRLVEKLRERCPLKYPLCIALSSLSPVQISVVKTSTLMKHFDKLLEILVNKEWISSVSADRSQTQYRELIGDKCFVKKCAEFDVLHSRVDEFFFEAVNDEAIDFLAVLKICLCLSHGNACVEAGFSVNEQILQENMHDSSIIAQRIVYEGIMEDGGILNVEISDEMIKYVQQSHKKYILALDERKAQQTEADKKRLNRKRLNKSIKNLHSEKKAALASASSVATDFDHRIHSLQEELRKIS